MKGLIARIEILTAIILLGSGFASAAQSQIPIVIGAGASSIEKIAAEELSAHLQRLYPDQHFSVTTSAPRGVAHILMGTATSLPAIDRYVPAAQVAKPESFVVTTAKDGNAEIGVVAGADPRGVLYGVYGLLEKLGYGFYMSYNTDPTPHPGPFRFEGWKLSDAPLFPDRAVFPWFNFLSGASAWELSDWQCWMTQIERMRYNTVMMHYYGNSPIFTWSFNGRTKPYGYFTSTAKGREWGTEHVNDVRRLFGGESFTGPVFGSSVALIPDEKRMDAAVNLMQKVFADAHDRDMHVAFVLDVDTLAANPQDLIQTLPASARIGSSGFQLANPDTPEGFEYYRAEISALFGLYPQIDRLVAFQRFEETPWQGIKMENLSETWKAQIASAIEKDPRLGDDPKTIPIFVASRMIAAFDKILRGLGRTDVELAGSAFAYDHLQAADYFFTPQTALLVMDQAESMEAEGTEALLRQVGAHRKIYPVFWANHDGRGYMTRPVTPFANFATFLRNRNSTGVGIIQWDTRPLDIYFKSLSAQMWQQTENQSLALTTREMAAHTLGDAAGETGGTYLLKWVTESPRFGRETTDRFISHQLRDPTEVLAKCHERLALLAKIDQGQLAAAGKQWVDYYNGIERFIIGVFESQTAWEKAQTAREEGDIERARRALAASKPESVIEQYAHFSSLGGITRGEQGIIVTLNLRWLPYIVSERQAEGLEPIRVKFEPTFHEDLAMDSGVNTFYFDKERHIWKGLGEKEMRRPVFVDTQSAPDAVCSSGLQLEKGLAFQLAPIMGDRLIPGTYTVRLFFAPRPAFADITLRGSSSLLPALEHLKIQGGGTEPVEISRTLEVTEGALRVNISPTFGTAFVCGAILEPTASR